MTSEVSDCREHDCQVPSHAPHLIPFFNSQRSPSQADKVQRRGASCPNPHLTIRPASSELCRRLRSADGLNTSAYRLSHPQYFKANRALVDDLEVLAEKKGVTPSQLAIAWVGSLGPHVIPLPGSRYVPPSSRLPLHRSTVLRICYGFRARSPFCAGEFLAVADDQGTQDADLGTAFTCTATRRATSRTSLRETSS